MRQIDFERDQLLAQWKRAFARQSCWFTSPPPQVKRVLALETADRGMAVRKFHDKLGFCAKGTLKTGGLCAGAIFRTQAFIDLPQDERSGSRATQTVHIEHTVPAGVIAGRLGAQLSDVRHTGDLSLAWLFKHSVVTAMRKGQDASFLRGVTRSTTAFDAGLDEGKPFRRYRELFAANEIVWDVWNRKEVDPDNFTFHSHIETVLDILHEAGADSNFKKRVEAAA